MCASTCIPAAQCGTCQATGQTCTTTCQTSCQTACESSCQTGCEVANQVIHKTLVNSTAYTIKKGNVLVNGTGYGLSKGRTLVGGTGYDISFTKHSFPDTEWVMSDLSSTNSYHRHNTKIIYANNMFLAYNDFSSNENGGSFQYSTDGITWSTRSASLPFRSGSRYLFTYQGGKWFAIGKDPSSTYGGVSSFYSTGGISSWKEFDYGNVSTTAKLPVYGNGVYVGAGTISNMLNTRSYILTSTDGINWTSTLDGNLVSSGTTLNDCTSVTFGAGVFVGVTGSKTYYISENGSTWTSGTLPRAADTIVYCGNKFFALYDNSTSSNSYSYSTDGRSWTQGTFNKSVIWNDIAYGEGIYVAVGSNSSASYSEDGILWTDCSFPSGVHRNQNWTGIAYGADAFVTVCAYGTSSSTQYAHKAYRVHY